jgi:hypothetical protein
VGGPGGFKVLTQASIVLIQGISHDSKRWHREAPQRTETDLASHLMLMYHGFASQVCERVQRGQPLQTQTFRKMRREQSPHPVAKRTWRAHSVCCVTGL